MNDVLVEVVQEGRAPYQVQLGAAPLMLGRAPSNDIALSDEQVSWHHAMLWRERGRVWLRDMGSSNGTFVDEERIRAMVEVVSGAQVRLGTQVWLRIRGLADIPAEARPMVLAFLVEDCSSGVRLPLRSDRFHIGSGKDCDLHIEDAPERAATLIVHANGEIWLGTDESESLLQPEQHFEVAGRQLQLKSSKSTQAPTLQPEPDRYPYRLTVSLDGATGPEATLEALNSGDRYRVDAENRAVLLYVLARQVQRDREEGLGEDDQGWCADEDVSVGVWGKHAGGDANNLHVLVYRLRKELKKQGFDPWFLEKRRRALRVRLREVVVE